MSGPEQGLKPCPWGCKGVYIGGYGHLARMYGCPHAYDGIEPTESRIELARRWNTRPLEDAKDREIATLTARVAELENLIIAVSAEVSEEQILFHISHEADLILTARAASKTGDKS